MVPELNNEYPHAIVQVIEPNKLLFWGILHKGVDGQYAPILFKKDRSGYITVPEYLPLKDTKEEIEKKLMDDGIIQDGDILEDETESCP